MDCGSRSHGLHPVAAQENVVPYTLITVTYGGTVSHSRGYETLRMCQEARSIALYGMTIAEKEEADRREVEQRRTEWNAQDAKRRAAWLINHPGRAPTPKEAEDIRRGILEWNHDPYGAEAVQERVKISEMLSDNLVLSKSRLAADGLIYDDFTVAWSVSSAIQISSPGTFWAYDNDPRARKGLSDIKSAHCVIEVPDSPVEEKAA